MTASRRPPFYEALAVPDTMDGRYDLLLIHVFLILHRLLDRADGKPSDLSQALFDVCFEDIDQALRESGVGDMKIGKHMKKMMLAFNGRMHAYEKASSIGMDALEEAVARNLYGTLETVPEQAVKIVAAYMQDNIVFLEAQGESDIAAGRVTFQTQTLKGV
ncbi:MAG: hypothetical protein LRZ85_01430 [Alphaproteobacteria bacterium]|nr:hypothetical protein [Alphaproteobacteria bacterium]MCD8571279.1 hypothetical protein [Alphaproteobacteria bacterium]